MLHQNNSPWLTLHDEEVGVVHVQLDRVEEIGHLPRGLDLSVDQILALPPDEHLARDIDLLELLVPHGARGFVLIVEHDGDAGLVDARLALLVHELGEVAGADLGQVGDSQDEADGVEDVGFSRPVEARDGVEVGVEPARGWEEGGVRSTSASASRDRIKRCRSP